MRFLCRIGLHDWRYTDKIFRVTVETRDGQYPEDNQQRKCQSCGKLGMKPIKEFVG